MDFSERNRTILNCTDINVTEFMVSNKFYVYEAFYLKPMVTRHSVLSDEQASLLFAKYMYISRLLFERTKDPAIINDVLELYSFCLEHKRFDLVRILRAHGLVHVVLKHPCIVDIIANGELTETTKNSGEEGER